METRYSVFWSKAKRIEFLEERVRDVESDLWLQVEWNREQVQRIDQLEALLTSQAKLLADQSALLIRPAELISELASQQDKLANDSRELRRKLSTKGLI